MPSIKKELERYGLFPHKGWGQHFLIDRTVLAKVVHTAQVEPGDVVLEVGPGLGAMTLALARRAKRVIAVEIDARLVSILKNKAQGYPNVEIIQGDILEVDLQRFVRPEGPPVKVVANLPYQISTPLLFRLIESREIFSTLTLMLQREVAERLVARPGGKAYGPLSIFVQLLSILKIEFFVKPSAFFPPPKVDSAVVCVQWRERPMVALRDERWFKQVVRACFNYRRKMLANGLKQSGLSLPEDLIPKIQQIGIDPRRRPETLSIQEFAALAEALKG